MKPNILEIDKVQNKKVCATCIGEKYVSEEVLKIGTESQCDYCKDESKIISIDEFSIKVEKAIDEHFIRTPHYPDDYEAFLQREGHEWWRGGDQINYVITSRAMVSEEIAEDVRKVIDYRTYSFEALNEGEENPFVKEAHYEKKQPEEHKDHKLQVEWAAFERSIKYESRFFSQHAQETLEKIFTNANKLNSDSKLPLIVDIGPETKIKSLYRARVFQTEDDLKESIERPDSHLGPPPSKLAVAGRMNPQGIAVFYGATNAKLAIAEVRPPVGSKVVTGEFIIQRSLKLLMVDALSELFFSGSIFDPGYIERLEYGQFLKKLREKISRPILPNDEAQEYLVTQAIAEYLSELHEPRLDGIVFESAQMKNKDRNIVLFHHAAKVESIVLPAGTELSSNTESRDDEGKYADYFVLEELPHEDDKNDDGDKEEDEEDFYILEPQDDPRENSLKLNLQSISVHHVKGIKYNTKSYPVTRHRFDSFKEGEEPF